jgi:type IV pilus assembly protein PilN
MPRINLLPWRDEERKERKLKFLVALGGAAVGACLTVFVGYLMMDSMVSAQESRNQQLKTQIEELDKQIEKINSLEADKARFISRMEVIEKLQRSRPEIVHIFDEIAKQLPDGVYLTGMKQTNDKVAIAGTAQSNERVSELLRNLSTASPWITKPELVEIVAGNVALSPKDQRRVANFKMTVTLVRASEAQKAASAASGAAAAAPAASAASAAVVGAAPAVPVKQ